MARLAPYFELWENRSGNLIAEFETEAAALQFVRDAVKDGGTAQVLSWSLHRSDASSPIAYGKKLCALLNTRLSV